MPDLTGLDEHRLLLRALQEAADHQGIGLVVAQISEPVRLIYLNEGAATIFGRTRAELEGANAYILFPPELVEQERERVRVRGSGMAPPIMYETIISRPDGTRVPLEIALSRVVTAASTLTVGFVRDITARIQALETLRRSEERFRRVVEGAPDGVAITQRGRLVFVNELAAKLFGAPSQKETIGTHVTDHLVPEDAAIAVERMSRILKTGESFEPLEYRPKAFPDRVIEIKSILIEYEGEPAVLSFARDTTARKRMQQELVRADRLASIGMMSAAVAHEINNPLTYVQLCLQYLEKELPGLVQGEQRTRVLEQVRNASQGIERVATIVRDLRSFARADDGELGSVDVIATVEQALKLVDNEVRHRAQVVRDFEAVPPVHGNASRLGQVFVNILINAAQAIAGGDPREHEIRIAVRRRDPNVEVAISDSGPGIAPELRDRVFEPFFSTKAVGVGTGLGLAVCRSIIEQLGGRIELAPAVPRGATVTVALPIHRGDAQAAAVDEEVEEGAARRLRVLVVDDEPLVRRALATVLGRHHDVVLAENGRQAIEQLAAHRIDVVMCDVMMPVMSGKELYQHLIEHDAALARRFIFITGGSFGSAAGFLEQVQALVLHKPFELAKVLELVAAAAER